MRFGAAFYGTFFGLRDRRSPVRVLSRQSRTAGRAVQSRSKRHGRQKRLATVRPLGSRLGAFAWYLQELRGVGTHMADLDVMLTAHRRPRPLGARSHRDNGCRREGRRLPVR